MVIKVPKDVWQQIIDKIEPESYKLPEFIVYDTTCIRSSRIDSLQGPFYFNNQPYINICIEGCNNMPIRQMKYPGLYNKLECMIKHYKEECEK